MTNVVQFNPKHPRDPLEFNQGDTLVKDDEKQAYFVLSVEDGGQCAMLVPLVSDGWFGQYGKKEPAFSATLKEMEGWYPAYLDGPRLVVAYRVNTDEKLWEAYLPNINAALELADHVYGSEARDIDLKIHTQHTDEDVDLDHRGYWNV